jgi:nucleotide-binding universal stress UspA family protein
MAGRIVVGVDGSDGSVEALRWALVEARLRGATVEVIHSWHYPYGAYTEITGMAAGVISGEDLAKLGHEVVDRTLQLAGAASSGVQVDPIVAQGAAAAVLIDAARGADLLVVGSRGHGGFTGILLGSVSQHAVHHATCPVVVVPHRRG